MDRKWSGPLRTLADADTARRTERGEPAAQQQQHKLGIPTADGHRRINGRRADCSSASAETRACLRSKSLGKRPARAVGDAPAPRRQAQPASPGHYFGCRHCHRLTYESAQTHDTRVSALRRNPARLAAILENPRAASIQQLMLALKALE